MPPFFTGLPVFRVVSDDGRRPAGQPWPRSQGSSPQEVALAEEKYGKTVEELVKMAEKYKVKVKEDHLKDYERVKSLVIQVPSKEEIQQDEKELEADSFDDDDLSEETLSTEDDIEEVDDSPEENFDDNDVIDVEEIETDCGEDDDDDE